jgi:hypothetical protein
VAVLSYYVADWRRRKGRARVMTSPGEHIEVLVNESDRVSTDIRQLESMVDKFIGFGIALIGAGFTYGVAQHAEEVFFLLPVAMFGIYYIFFDRMRTILWLGAYKRAVEDKINELSEGIVVNWEKLVQEHRGRADIIVLSGNFVYFLILLGVVGYSLIRVNNVYEMQTVCGVRIGYIYAALVALLAVLLGLCIWRFFTAYPPAYRLSREMLGVAKTEQSDH